MQEITAQQISKHNPNKTPNSKKKQHQDIKTLLIPLTNPNQLLRLLPPTHTPTFFPFPQSTLPKMLLHAGPSGEDIPALDAPRLLHVRGEELRRGKGGLRRLLGARSLLGAGGVGVAHVRGELVEGVEAVVAFGAGDGFVGEEHEGEARGVAGRLLCGVRLGFGGGGWWCF